MKRREILRMAEETGSKFVRLIDDENRVIIPINTPRIKIEERAEQIEKALKQDSLYPDGNYILELFKSVKGNPLKIRYKKGSNDKPDSIILNDPGKLDRSAEDKIKFLESKIAELEEIINEEETEIAEAPEPFAWIKDTVQSLLPLADSFLEIQKIKANREIQPLNDPGKDYSGFIAKVFIMMAQEPNETMYQNLLNELKAMDTATFTKVVNIIRSHEPQPQPPTSGGL